MKTDDTDFPKPKRPQPEDFTGKPSRIARKPKRGWQRRPKGRGR